jgi:hypothetical protein
MRVLLKFTLDCEPDAAWRAVRSPVVFRAVSRPLTRFTSLEENGFPDEWSPGVHPVRMYAAGNILVGDQTIDLEFITRPATAKRGEVRIVRDTGRGLSGPLALVTRWEHSMAIAAAPGGRTLYRDQLDFSVGPLTLLAWPLYWAFWQWRGAAMRRLAPTWK